MIYFKLLFILCLECRIAIRHIKTKETDDKGIDGRPKYNFNK